MGERSIDQAVVAGAQAGAVVPTAAHGEGEAVCAREGDGGDDVGHVDAAGDQRRAPVDHAVIDAAALLIGGVAGLNHLAAQASAQFLYEPPRRVRVRRVDR